MALTESAIGLGRETVAYGTLSTALDAGYEGQSDAWKRTQEPLVSQGFRPGRQTARGDRRTEINKGGEASLEFDVLTQGFGRIMWGLLGQSVGTVAAGGGLLATTTSEVDAPGNPFTVQVVRVDAGDVKRIFNHLGSVVTGWGLNCEPDGHAVFNADWDVQDIVDNGVEETLNYRAGSPFTWADMVVNVDGANVDATSFGFEAELGLKTDREFLRGSTLKKQPVRTTLPTYQGEIGVEFEDLTQYQKWTSGAEFPIVATWTGADYGGGNNYLLRLTVAAARYSGESPEANLDDMPMQTLPWVAVDDGAPGLITLEYRSDDAAVT